MKIINKDFFIILIVQILTSTMTSLLTSVSGLSGAYLASNKSFSTIPVSATALGGLVLMFPASFIMGKFGRKKGFLLASGIALIASMLCVLGLFLKLFFVFCFGTFMMGIFFAFSQYYRFAATETIITKNQQEAAKKQATAISIVSGVGILGAIAGPLLGSKSYGLIKTIPYIGAYVSLGVISILLLFLFSFMSEYLGNINTDNSTVKPVNLKLKFDKRCLHVIVIGAIGASTMTFVMNATPITLMNMNVPTAFSAYIMQVHFASMYLPAFLIPIIMKAVSPKKIVYLGILILTLESIIAIIFEQSALLMLVELSMLGVGWCFITNPATIMLVEMFSKSEKTSVQGIYNFVSAACVTFASFSSGVVLGIWEWGKLNLLYIPFLIFAFIITLSIKEKSDLSCS